jgi:hypothetical protein
MEVRSKLEKNFKELGSKMELGSKLKALKS